MDSVILSLNKCALESLSLQRFCVNIKVTTDGKRSFYDFDAQDVFPPDDDNKAYLSLLNLHRVSKLWRKYVSVFPSFNLTFRSEAFTQFLKMCLFMAELSFAYFLMLITMTYNTWLFIAVVIGRGLGFYLVTPLMISYEGREETGDYIDISMDSLSTRHQQL